LKKIDSRQTSTTFQKKYKFKVSQLEILKKLGILLDIIVVQRTEFA